MVVMMAQNERVKQKYISKKVVEWRRKRVLELRLAGLSPAAIAAELRKEKMFEHTTEHHVWSDIYALEKRAKLDEIEGEVIVREIFQSCRDSIYVVSRAGHRRLEEINQRIARVQEEIADVDEQLRDPGQPLNRRGELIIECDRLVSLAGKLRAQARDETRVILSINRTLADMPRKLGLIYDKTEIGFHDQTKEAMIEAIENAPTPEARKELIKAAELFGRAFVNN